MSEAIWESGDRLRDLIHLPQVLVQERKVRLFGIASIRHLDPELLTGPLPVALDAAEQYAEGEMAADVTVHEPGWSAVA